ncbi:hypothetical protein [Gorillibacterium timonense]|uniref:hypothetical protein n=1 Tax=Gorillibacterium timonense TaxID=1689269 RepID=UPI0011DE564B|nr:hypothetical protein [Gorillibacterium timonense]
MGFVVEAVLIGCLLITICSLWFMFHSYKNAKKAYVEVKREYEAAILGYEGCKKEYETAKNCYEEARHEYEIAKNQYEGEQSVVRGASDTEGS